jgi:hypothetical protein
MQILKRPFSIEPITGVMLPDGIFDAAIYKQKITCYYTNTGSSILTDVQIYIEGISDPGIKCEANTFFFAQIPKDASVQVSWLADFQYASPGKKNVSFIAKSAGLEFRRSIKQIFVTKSTFDPLTSTFTCSVPEGSLKVKFHRIIGPSKTGWEDCNHEERKNNGPWILTKTSMVVIPNPSYTGQFGDLPFQDPAWWKVIGWIVFAVASLVAIITAAGGSGTVGFGVSGTFEESDPSIDCCSPDPKTTKNTTGTKTVAGVASTIASIGLAAGLADLKDPWRRGQEATPTEPGEITLSESLKADFEYPSPPQAGKPFIVNVNWIYTRITNIKSHVFEITETVNNIHLLDHMEIEAPAKIVHFEPSFIVKARFYRDKNTMYFGDQLFAYALIISPSNIGFYLPLIDDGIKSDENANDGTYTGLFDLKKIYKQLLKEGEKFEGIWRVYIYAQDTNDATPSMSPIEAASHIGGFMIASATEISFDSSVPCPLKSDATIEVIV